MNQFFEWLKGTASCSPKITINSISINQSVNTHAGVRETQADVNHFDECMCVFRVFRAHKMCLPEVEEEGVGSAE